MNARDLSLEVLRRVFTQGAFASTALRNAFDRSPTLPQNERTLTTELIYNVLRRREHLDRDLSRTGKRLKDLDPHIHDILRLDAYQIMFLDRVPAHAAVSETVEQTKKRTGPKTDRQVNAILRKLSSTPPEERLRAPADAKAEPAHHLAEVDSVPLALAEVLLADLGFEATLAFLLTSLEIASLTLRANHLKTTRETLAEEVGNSARQNAWTVRLPSRANSLPADLLTIVEGRATPQDEASMAVVELLAPRANDNVLDVCTAPNEKTTHATEMMSDRKTILAHDRLPDRLARVGEQTERLGLRSITTTNILPPEDQLFDRVLVDAPCTDLSTLRHHPEIRWRYTKDQIAELTKIQNDVLAQGRARMKPNDVLIYAICTVTRAEGEAHLTEVGTDFELAELLHTRPDQPDAPDDFFAAKWIRKLA